MIKNNKLIIGLLLFFFVVSMSSCATTPVCLTASNTPLNDKKISENLGRVEGKGNMTFSVFGLWMIGKPDIQSAIDNALSKKSADALINIKCYEEYMYFLFVSITNVKVEGEAVKFDRYEDINAQQKK